MRVFVLLIGMFAASSLVGDVTNCTNGDLKRGVEVIYSDPGQSTPCEVLYTKPTEGSSSTPWRAQSEGGYCEAKAAALIERLVAWGWQCGASNSKEDNAKQDAADSLTEGMVEDKAEIQKSKNYS